MASEKERTTLNTLTGGGCACGCCGDTADEQPKSQQEELTELREVREQIQRRLAELGAE